MKITNYLRFTDQTTWETKATEVGIRVQYEDEWVIQYYTHEHSIDVVGIIYNNDGVYNEETGEVVTLPSAMEGWHVNYKTDALPDALTEYIVTPSSPHRKFAGD